MNDKLLHLIVGFGIGVFTFICYFAITRNLKYSILAAISMGLCMGTFKEFRDHIDSTGTVDMLDILATVIGSWCGSCFMAAIYITFKK